MEPDESAEQVRIPPAERDRESRSAAAIEQSPRFGRRLDTWGWLALFGGAALVGVDIGGNSGEGLGWAGVAQLVVGLVVMLFGLWAVLRGRRHRSVVLPDLGAVPEGEGAVLFLRAFSDERGFARTAASRPLRWLLWPPPITPSELRTEEEQVARAVAPFGRMMALGPTSDRLPRTGANRSYASDEEWQSKVRRALDEANLVLLTAGSGDQLEWEVEQAVRHGDPTRLVLVVPRTRGQYGDFRQRLGGLFPRGLPEAPEARTSRVRYVRAVVWFDPDWTPHLELLTGRFPMFRRAARTQYALPRALRPVYERAGLSAPTRDASAVSRPRSVPAAVALFSVAGWAIPLGFFLIGPLFFESRPDPASSGLLNTGNEVGDWFVGLGLAVLFAIPFAVWMRRVLRGGPIAILTVLFLSPVPGFSLLGWAMGLAVFAIPALFEGSAVGVVAALLGALHLLVVAVAVPVIVCLLLFRRDVRDWVESRT